MRKTVLLVLGLIVLAFLALIIFYFSKAPEKLSQNQESVALTAQTAEGKKEIILEFKTDYPGLTVTFIDKEGFVSFLKEKGIVERLGTDGMVDLNNDTRKIPEKIVIVLTSKEQTTLPLTTQTEDGEPMLLRGFGGGFTNDNEYELLVYVNNAVFTKDSWSTYKNSLTTSYAVEGLYSVTAVGENSSDILDKLEQIQKEIVTEKNYNFITVSYKTSLERLFDIVSKEVHAQTCETASPRGCWTGSSYLGCVLQTGCASEGSTCGNVGVEGTCRSVWGDGLVCVRNSYSCAAPGGDCGTAYTPGTCLTIQECTGFYARSCEVISGLCTTRECNPMFACNPDHSDDPSPSCYWTGPTPTPTPSGGGPTNTPTPGPLPNNAPGCTLSGPNSTTQGTSETYTANCTDPEGRLNRIEMYKSPTGTDSWASVGSCAVGGGSASCVGSTSFSPSGSYYVTVNGFDNDGGQCSGNPWCEWAPNPPNPYNCAASGWSDCSASDVITVNVVAPSCQISISNANLSAPGDTQSKTVTVVSEVGGTVDTVDFSSTNPSVVTVTSPDNSAPFQTTLTATGVGSASYEAVGTMVDEGGIICTPNPASAAVSVNDATAWWQVKEGDAVTNGDITSAIPATCSLPACNPVFVDNDSGNYPGVPTANSSNFGTGTVSSTGWKAEPSSFSIPRRQDFEYFEKRIPEGASVFNIPASNIPVGGVNVTTLTSAYNGYYYLKYDGSTFGGSDLTLTGDLDIGSAKAVLFVKNASVIFEGRVNVTDGQGFFLVISDEDISFDANVGGGATPHYEGLYMADGVIHTGSIGANSDSQLRIRGSLVGLGNGWLAPADQGVNLQRDLTDDTTQPAERIEYAPDQALLFPPDLASRKVQWREVAP